jgi:23S rRNA maturation-related 3'-5' exoribonuclease YhaM
MPTIDENISRFEQLLSSVQRDGIDKLMRYIKKNTDFYKAPASTRFHLACEGGLLQHSLNVYDLENRK